jgi:NADH-quinone oxidoreductase subunit L
MMHYLILTMVAIPLFGFLMITVLRTSSEKWNSGIAIATTWLQFIASSCTAIYWLSSGHHPVNEKDWTLYTTHDYEFFFDFFFDKVSAAFVLVGSFLSSLVCLYSRTYMHREAGYRRFFQTILFFFLGYNITVLSGNLETLFIGWEILGVSSFLLIAFYRDRYLPVKNAVKVFSIYRIGDVGILLAMWLSHHLWHANVTFSELASYHEVHDHIAHYSGLALAVSLLLVLSAMAKSALFPFSTWLPRAMEGPTPSSAIFYGSLSVHLGLFLLLRTYHFWEHQITVRIVLFSIGVISFVIATGIAQVQSSIKSQIAYGSIAQIGIMLTELSFGWIDLALIHFAANAFFRTYQLLVSPSVVSYKIRDQFYHFVPREKHVPRGLSTRLAYGLYVLSLREWNLDTLMHRLLWNPVKSLGKRFDFLTLSRTLWVFAGLLIAGSIALYSNYSLPNQINRFVPFLFALAGIVMVLKAFTERHNPFIALVMVVMNHFMVVIAVAFNEQYDWREGLLYISGVCVAGLAGYLILKRFKKFEKNLDLHQFHGHSHIHPGVAFAFLLCCLGLSGFPITPTFLGEDLIFSHIHEDQIGLAALVAFSFILDGLAIIRLYARLFLGPHSQSVYEMGYRAS